MGRLFSSALRFLGGGGNGGCQEQADFGLDIFGAIR
jgi:hypothetical protein